MIIERIETRDKKGKVVSVAFKVDGVEQTLEQAIAAKAKAKAEAKAKGIKPELMGKETNERI